MKKFALGKVTGILLSKAAEGAFGPRVQALYWWLAGHKTQVAAALALPPLIIEALARSGACQAFSLPCDIWDSRLSAALLSISGVLTYVGQVDGALRMGAPEVPPPKP